jgi:hypothetical protein
MGDLFEDFGWDWDDMGMFGGMSEEFADYYRQYSVCKFQPIIIL